MGDQQLGGGPALAYRGDGEVLVTIIPVGKLHQEGGAHRAGILATLPISVHYPDTPPVPDRGTNIRHPPLLQYRCFQEPKE